MNCGHRFKVALLLIIVIAFIGCKSKQDAPTAKPGIQPQTTGEIKTIAGQNTSGGIATSPQDKSDAETAAARVLAQLAAGEFVAVYNEASPAFKNIGTEVDFVTTFQQKRKSTGALKNPKETSFITRPGNTHVLVYRLENEHVTTDMRLTFERGKDGKMVLAGLNEHDDLKR